MLGYVDGDGSTLSFDFTTGVLDPSLTFTRSTNATFINSQGLVQYAAANEFLNTLWITSTTPTGWNIGFGTGTTTWNNNGTVTMDTGPSSTRPMINASSMTVAVGIPHTFGYRVVSVSGSPTVGNVIHSTVAGETYAINGVTQPSSTVVVAGDIVSCTFTPTASPVPPRMGPGVQGGMTNTAMTITQPQMNRGTTLQPYLQNSSTSVGNFNTPRFDYDFTAQTPRGLLIEGSATNLATQSNGSTSVWTVGNFRTPTNNTTDIVSPDGTNNATKLVCGAATNYASFATSITGLTGGNTYTVSYWIRGPVGHTPRLYALNGTIGDITATSTTGTYNNTGWTRLTQTYTLPATTTQVYVYFISVGIVTTGDTFYVYGFQLESGSGASSYIPTGASTGFRAQDVVTMSNISSLGFDKYQGAFVIRGFQYKEGTVGAYSRTLRFNGSTEPMGMPVDGVTFFGTSRNVGDNIIGENTRTNTLVQNYAFGFSLNANSTTAAMVVSLNGSSVVSSRSNTGPTSDATSLEFNSNSSDTAYASMAIKSVKFWPIAKSSAEMNALTTG